MAIASLTPSPNSPRIADRYVAHRPIGQGGVAVIYEATDTQTGRRVALKRLRAELATEQVQRLNELFEREYHTLCQLSHPRIVEVYDYALDAQGPYYTMELLDGGDLQKLAPLPWAKACAIGRDICSALSLLHSRRLVHRDVSTRNIRCTSDGTAKLIDFGAMVPMGPVKHFVGTPPFCAPEVVECQPLDARADLFALGAALYFTLVGRHAYPARDVRQLLDLWRGTVTPPSELVADIPAELDALVLDLLRADRATRPASAGEVMERLAGIEGVSVDDHLRMARAYLSTPTLVGRARPLERMKRRLARAQDGRGSATLVEGAPGVGRSRFLDACALEARMLGHQVLRVDADDAHQGDYGTVRALARQLLRIRPHAALAAAEPYSTTLRLAIPELVDSSTANAPHTPFASGERGAVQDALQEWVLTALEDTPTLVTVDDVHRVDEPSAAFFALLSQGIRDSSLAILLSTESDAQANAPAAVELLLKSAKRITLEPLDPAGTRELLASVFGDVPHADLLVHRLYPVSGGTPGDILRLAQHLVDRGVVRYQGGVWSVPSDIDPKDLPSSITQALRARLSSLSEDARWLARAFALRPEHRFQLTDCLLLCRHDDEAHLRSAVEELLRCEVLKASGDELMLGHISWAELLLEGAHRDEQELHCRLATLFEQSGRDMFRAAQHRLRAGHIEAGLDRLVTHARSTQKVTSYSPAAYIELILSLPDDWYETYDRAIQLSLELGLQARQTYELRKRLIGMISVMGIFDRKHVVAFLDQLARLAGLKDWSELGSDMDPAARIREALERAGRRHHESAEHERVIDPKTAIRQLSRVLIQTASMITAALDLPYLRRQPSLAPFAPLSPAVRVIHMLLQGLHARMTGRDDARAIYQEVLERTEQPDRAGLDESHHKYLRLGMRSGLAMLEASMGFRICLDHAEICDADPFYRLNGLRIRALFHLWQGDVNAADHYQKQVELLRIQSAPRSFLEGTHLPWQLAAHGLSDDLKRVKETLREIEPLAERHAGWQPVRSHGLGELHRIRGAHARALVHFEEALAVAAPGEHQMWARTAGARLRTLNAQNRHEEAKRAGTDYLKAAEEARLTQLAHFIRMPLAIAHAQLGEGRDAELLADRVLHDLEVLRVTGLNLGLAHETRARVAWACDDWEAAKHHVELCRAILGAHDCASLSSKIARLERAFQRARAAALGAASHGKGEALRPRHTDRVQALDMLETAEERAQHVLAELAEVSGTQHGALYVLAGGELSRCAQLDLVDAPEKLDDLAMKLAGAIMDEAEQTVTSYGTVDDIASELVSSQGGRYHPVTLQHTASFGHTFTGLVLLWMPEGATFEPPTRLAARLSRRLQELGDVSARTLF